jgi:hypothetical protein
MGKKTFASPDEFATLDKYPQSDVFALFPRMQTRKARFRL